VPIRRDFVRRSTGEKGIDHVFVAVDIAFVRDSKDGNRWVWRWSGCSGYDKKVNA
jgi:hypothetical protein